MFIGEYEHTIDQKGRINVPAKLREVLGTSFIMTKGLDGCIFVYHKDDWKKFEEMFEKAPISSENARRFTRYFFSNATPCEPDNLGRVNIPEKLRKHAGLDKKIVTIGNRDRVEIWDKNRWDNYNDEETYNDKVIAEIMAEYGI